MPGMPSAKTMQANIYVFLKGKLMPLDNTLPLLVALRTHRQLFDVTIVSTDQKFADLIAGENLIRATLKKFRIKVNSPKDGEMLLGKGVRLLMLAAGMLVDSVSRPMFLINSSQIKKGSRYFWFLMAINKALHGGKFIELKLIPTTEKVDRFLREALNSQYQRSIEKIAIARCDVVISSLPRSEFREILAAEFVEVGYGRGFESWTRQVDSALSDIEQEIIDDFIFWPLSVLQRSEKAEDVDLRDTIAGTIRLMMKAGITSQIVFRYHPTTDRSEFQKIIRDTGLSNYVISNSHPHQLIRKCRFVFSNTGTSLFCDARFFRKPVVQYTPTGGTYCVRDEAGSPLSSIYQPAVNKFISSESGFREFLLDMESQSSLMELVQAESMEGFSLTSIDEERSLIDKVFGC